MIIKKLNDKRSLTHNCNRIDVVNCQNQGYSSKFGNRDSRSSSIDFFLVNRRNLDLKHSVDAETSIEVIGIKRFMRFGVETV